MVSRVSLGLQVVSALAFSADWYFYYQISTKNFIPLREEAVFSQAMIKNEKSKKIGSFLIKNDSNETNEKKFIELHKEEIIDKLLQQKIHLESALETTNFIPIYTAKLAVRPLKLSIHFNQEYAIIVVSE